jgi:sugar phosphate isomerase/epimerase
MKFLLSSPQLWAYTPEETLSGAAELGYDGVELWAYHLLRDQANPSALRRQAEDLGLVLSLHALSWDLNFCSPLEPIRTASLTLLEQSIELAAAVGASIVVMHPGRITVPQGRADDYWALLVRGLRHLAQRAADRGVRLAVEHMERLPAELVVSPADVERLLADVNHPNLVVAFDFAHVPWDEDPLDYFDRMPSVGHVHLSDADSRRYHLPLGEGKRDLAAFLSALAPRYVGFVAVEGIEHQRTTALAAANKRVWDLLRRRIAS